MEVRSCVDCGQYKYIKSDGLCVDCYEGSDDKNDFKYTYTNVSNRFGSKLGYNQFVLGMIGSGKTVGNKIEICDAHKEPKTNVYVVDPLGAYHKLVNEIGGDLIKIGTKDYFNLMRIEKSITNNGSLAEKVDTLTDMILRCYSVTGNSITKTERRLLTESIRRTYTRNGITDDVKTHTNTSPTLGQLLNTIQDIHTNPQSLLRSSFSSQNQKTIRASLMSLYTDLENIIKQLKLGNSMPINLQKNDLTYFDVSSSASEIRGLKMQMVLNEVWQYARSSNTNDLLYIDNAKFLFSDTNEAIQSLGKMFARARHYNIGICLSMVPDKQVLKSSFGKDILMNCDYLRLHRMTKQLNHVENILNLSDQDSKYLRNAKIGSNTNGAEVLVSEPNHGYLQETIHVDNKFLSEIH